MKRPALSFSATQPRATQLTQCLLAMALLSMLVALIFAQRGHSVFVLDDLMFIVGDPNMHATHIGFDGIGRLLRGVNPEAANRPLPLVSFMLDWWRGDGDPAVFYRTNIMFHGVNALLVFLLSRKIILVAGVPRRAPAAAIAFFAAALWAAHPIHMNAVAYIWQRSTEMAATGVLAGLFFYLSARTAKNARRRIGFWCASLIALLIACASKENAWIAPALLVLVEIGVMRNHAASPFANRFEKIAFALLLVGAACLAVALFDGPLAERLKRTNLNYSAWDFTLAQRLLTQPRVIFFHLTQLAWPAPGRFAIEHDIDISSGVFEPPTTALALCFVALWLGAAVTLLCLRGRRAYGALLAFPLAALAVESSVIPIDMIFEQRMYLPSVTLFILGALALALLPRRLFLWSAPALVLILALCGAAYLRHWNSTLDIYASAAPHAAASIRVQYNYANALSDAGRYDDAVLHYRKTYSVRSPSVNRINVIDVGSIHFNEALALIKLERQAEAIQALETATQIKPGHQKAHLALANLYAGQGNRAQARLHLELVLRLDPSDPRARRMLEQLAAPPSRQ